MNHYALIWIDHRQAKIFTIAGETNSGETIASERPHQHLHRKADHIGLGKPERDDGFLEAVTKAIAGANGILITGPSTAKTELAQFIRERHPAMADLIWGVEALDHQTDGQLTALGRKYFRAERRMHPSSASQP